MTFLKKIHEAVKRSLGMGGKNEDVIMGKQSASKVNEVIAGKQAGSSYTETIEKIHDHTTDLVKPFLEHDQQIRFHISNGEVHFHDDANKLKAVISVADWFVVWRSLLSNQLATKVDLTNSTIIHFIPFRNEDDEFDIVVEITPKKIAERVKKLQKLTGR